MLMMGRGTDDELLIGVFGVPLELLVEREGADSLLGASRATMRIPSFVDDVVSAMRQMGTSTGCSPWMLLLICIQICQSRVYSGETAISVDSRS